MPLAVRPMAARAVLVWAVLAGLFFMHGVASPAGGCRDGVPVSAITMPLMPAVGTAGAGHLAATRTPAPSAAPLEGDSCCGAMLCSSRQPRQSHAGALAVPVSGAAVPVAPPVLPRLAAVAGHPRPPGSPGLPLPLFLGVSRT